MPIFFLFNHFLKARAKKCTKFCWFFGGWENLVFCFRDLLTFTVVWILDLEFLLVSFSHCPILLIYFIYLTDCYANLGGGMDPGSGVFTCPIAGSYLFIVHVCSADMHKALLSIRYY